MSQNTHISCVIILSHLAESEDDVLVVLADVVHAGVIPGRDVLLRNVTVRRVTLVITLMEKGFTSPFYALSTRIFLTHPLTDTVFIRGHNEDGDEDDSEESNQSSEDSEADGVCPAPECQLLWTGREDTEQGGRVHKERSEPRVLETAAVRVVTPSAVVFTARRLGLCLNGQRRGPTH